eukprot:COSAG01_NODE_5191_length_4421_cov_59.692503_5_plen_165_part_00
MITIGANLCSTRAHLGAHVDVDGRSDGYTAPGAVAAIKRDLGDVQVGGAVLRQPGGGCLAAGVATKVEQVLPLPSTCHATPRAYGAAHNPREDTTRHAGQPRPSFRPRRQAPTTALGVYSEQALLDAAGVLRYRRARFSGGWRDVYAAGAPKLGCAMIVPPSMR